MDDHQNNLHDAFPYIWHRLLYLPMFSSNICNGITSVVGVVLSMSGILSIRCTTCVGLVSSLKWFSRSSRMNGSGSRPIPMLTLGSVYVHILPLSRHIPNVVVGKNLLSSGAFIRILTGLCGWGSLVSAMSFNLVFLEIWYVPKLLYLLWAEL